MDAEDTQHDPLRDAREAALRRIGELRQRSVAPGEPAGPDLRTLLARSERHVDELRRSASELAALLPTRVEAAVARALGEDEGGLGRRIDHVVDQNGHLSAAVERVESDLLSERMARVEDLEVLVGLVSGGLTSLRAELRAVRPRARRSARRRRAAAARHGRTRTGDRGRGPWRRAGIAGRACERRGRGAWRPLAPASRRLLTRPRHIHA